MQHDHVTTRLKIIVGIATAGRREVLADVIDHLSRQTRLPDALLICPASPADVDEARLAQFPTPHQIIAGGRGLCAQRNAILDATDGDVIVFFDDDFLPANNFLAETERLFREQPKIVVATGKVIADGIHGPGIGVMHALTMLAEDEQSTAPRGNRFPVYNAYGCNMVLRLAAIRRNNARFDEILPLYGWQEDVDFCRRLAPYGEIVNDPVLRGIHLGAKRGRISGVRFGYSQIANPLYLVGKGTVSKRWALNLMSRNCVANILGSLRKPGMVDRRGRLKGNLMALWDAARRKMSPQRILTLE
jgi:GT2 family glycosyltransferase